MNLVLIFPPLADPTQPYSSLPALTAFLRDRGWKRIRQMDINIEFVRYILNGKRLEKALKRIENRLARLDGKSHLRGTEAAEYALLVKASLKAPFVAGGIASAVKELKTPECFRDLKWLNDSKRLVQEAMEILSAAAFPLRLSFSNSTGPSFTTPADLKKWILERERNPYRQFFETDTLPKLKGTSPDAIGISITYRGQVLAAATLSSLIKENLPGVPIIFGGNMVSHWYETIEACPELFRWCDYLIPFEGESALHDLLTALRNGLPLTGVPNLVYRFQGTVKKNPVIVEDIDSLPTPDYRGLPLDLYLAPENVFLLYTSRGCYWSQCRFCSVSASMRKGYRARSPGIIHRDIININERHNARYVTFVDDCVSPATLKAVASILRDKGPRIYWQCEVRFERELTARLLKDMRDAGCLNLIFGLESYSSHVLSLMKKGISHDRIERIIKDCRQYDIAFNLQFFFGFPGERAKDAEMTVEFIRKQVYGAATFSFGTFELQRGSMVDRNPGAFNIHYVDRTNGPLSVKYNYSPVPVHVEEIRARLREDLFRKNRYPHAGISINAHTLIFLHKSGVPAMGGLYRGSDSKEMEVKGYKANLMECRLVSQKKQTVGTFAHPPEGLIDGNTEDTPERERRILLYDYTLDRIVEVSPLVPWLLQGLDGTVTPSELIDSPHLLPAVHEAVKELYRRGFLSIPQM